MENCPLEVILCAVCTFIRKLIHTVPMRTLCTRDYNFACVFVCTYSLCILFVASHFLSFFVPVHPGRSDIVNPTTIIKLLIPVLILIVMGKASCFPVSFFSFPYPRFLCFFPLTLVFFFPFPYIRFLFFLNFTYGLFFFLIPLTIFS